MDVIYLFYGSCFISTGILIFAQPKKNSAFKFAEIVWLLAVFALIHGFTEWLNLLSFIHADNAQIQLLSLISLILSYCFLFEFGMRILIISENISKNGLSRYFKWYWLLIVFTFVFFIRIDTSVKFLYKGEILARYLLGLPGSFLTGAGFFLYYRHEKYALKHLNVDKYFLLAGISFWIYGILAGIVVPKGNFFPSNLFNSDNFYSMIGIPVQVFRAGAAPSIALAIVGIIRLFNKETNNELLRYNKQLEGMVTDRTQKLMNINVQLEDEIKIHKKMEQQLHLLTSRMFSIKEDERVMISREIHDELGQIMTRLKIDLSLLMEDMLESKCDKVYMEKLKSLSGYIDRIFKRIKDIAKFLRPKELDSLGLISAIKTYINDFQKHTGISCSLQYLLNCDERDIKFDDTTEIAIFRIIQEALTNIVRHSKANEACVIIENSIGFLRFSIKDNGRGISDSEISESGSLGLLGMKERAHMIGGEMNIVSAKDNGAVITLSIPLGDISEYDKNRYS